MYLEVVGFWGLICLAFFYIAEWKNKNVTIGLIGSILLVVLGIWLVGNPIEIKTGETSSLIQTSIANSSVSNITYTPTSGSEIKSNVYSAVSAGFFNLNLSLGLVFMLIGVLAGFKYAFAFKYGW